MIELPELVKLWRTEGLIPAEGEPLLRVEPTSVADYIRQQRMDRWREYCPAEFQKPINRDLLPNLDAWDTADQWDGSRPGLWLWSHQTGMGKTRMLWRKFCQLHVRSGKHVLRVTGANLAEEYHDAFNKSRTAEFYRMLTEPDVVMLDDLDKIPLPDAGLGFSAQDHGVRNARMLRELFDKFYESHRVVLVTANEPIAWFEERIGASGARRIRDVCKEVNFCDTIEARPKVIETQLRKGAA